MSFSFLKSKKFLIIIAVAILVLAPSSYAAASYHQSNQLIKEADKLEVAGDYTGAISKYDQALSKWKWNDSKIAPKKAIAQKNAVSNANFIQMTASFGAGEYQKCLEYLVKIETSFPQYSQVQNLNSDCQKKLDEQNAAIAAVAKAKTSTNTADTTAVRPVSDTMFDIISSNCKGLKATLCTDCVNNDATCKASLDKSFGVVDKNYGILCNGDIIPTQVEFCNVCKVHDEKCLAYTFTQGSR